MLPLPHRILTSFGDAAENALLGVYYSTSDHKISNITSEDLMLTLAIKVEEILKRSPRNVGEAIYEILNKHNADCNSLGMKKMAQVIERIGCIHTLLGMPHPHKKGI